MPPKRSYEYISRSRPPSNSFPYQTKKFKPNPTSLPLSSLSNSTPVNFSQLMITKFIRSQSLPTTTSLKHLKISYWNINGLRRITLDHSDWMKDAGNNLTHYVDSSKPDILCLGEVKINQKDLKYDKTVKYLRTLGYHDYVNCCKSLDGYSGTAIFTKLAPLTVQHDLGIIKHDQQGRVVTAEFDRFYVVSVYTPNSGTRKLEYRTKEWDPDFRRFVNKLKTKKAVVIAGDLNVAHGDMDVSEGFRESRFPGCTEEEKKTFGELLDCGWVDTFRYGHIFPLFLKRDRLVLCNRQM